jgi:hypothetical protein
MMIRVSLAVAAMLMSAMAVSAPTLPQLAEALDSVKVEEMVFDAAWGDTTVPLLNARIFDNGKGRNGYAGYLCMIISEHGINGGEVRLIDVASKEEKVLGRATCK